MKHSKKKIKSGRSKTKVDKSDWQEYDYHLPVLLTESVDFLINEKYIDDINSVYIDGTLGGGGHAKHIMQKIRGKLFAFDKDISAIERAFIIFEEEINRPSPSIVLFNKSFSEACSICENRGIMPNGILLDLGVSSKQLDSDQRGISYRVNSALDMRFDAGGENEANLTTNYTAKEVLNTKSEDELTAIFHKYGEEPKSRAIARRIVEDRRVKPLETTFDLRTIIEDCTPKIHHFKTLSRIFQALRIEVNKELDELSKTLNDIINILKPGGRIVVIAYHSLEDRIVKQILKENSYTTKTNKYATIENHTDKELDNSIAKTMPKLKLIVEKPIIPTEQEIIRNPRARSAKMRVAEKL